MPAVTDVGSVPLQKVYRDQITMVPAIDDEVLSAAIERVEEALVSSLDWEILVDNLAEEVLHAGIFRSLTVSLIDWEGEYAEIVGNYLSIDEDSGDIRPHRRVISSPAYTDRDQRPVAPLTGRRVSLKAIDDFTVWAARQGEVLVRGFLEYIEGEETRRKMGYFVPLRFGGRVAAVLATASPVDEQDEVQRRIEAMEPLFKQVALALEHARLHRSMAERNRQIEERNRLLRSLQQVEATLLSSLDRDEILDRLVVEIITAGIFESLMIALVDQRRSVVEVVRRYICKRFVEGKMVPVARSDEPIIYDIDDANITAQVARTGQMQVIDEWDERYDRRIDSANDRMGRTAYFIPLKKGDETVAVLATGSVIGQKAALLERMESMKPLFDMVVLALDHARLHGDLVQERHRLAVTLAHIGDGVVSTDRMGRIDHCNRPFCALVGMDEAAINGRIVADLLADYAVKKKAVEALMQSVLVHSQPAEEELMWSEAKGSPRILSIRGMPIRGEGIGGVFVVRDVTQERAREQDRQRIERIGTLELVAGGIAHDFNNLLASTLINASLLREGIADRAMHSTIVHDIEQSVQKAREMTGQLMRFVRSGALTRQKASLPEVVRESAVFALRGSNVQCHIDAGSDVWAVDVDATQISQVVQNLVLNAQQAMSEGGTVWIDLTNAQVDGRDGVPLPAGDYVRCAIRDTGVGIESGVLPHVFTPYFSTKSEGSGLGLSSSYAIVNQHGGWLAAESTEGIGSVFSFYLPRSVSRDEMRGSPTASDGARGVVLLLDDDEALGIAVARALTRLGYQIETVSVEDEAVARYADRNRAGSPFDVAVLDLTIPGGRGGVDVAHRLLAINPDVRLVLSTGHTQSEQLRNYRDHGFVDAIAKPYTIDELQRVLDRSMRRR